MVATTVTTCRCGQPTRDEAFCCDACGSRLMVALGDIPWLAEQLDTTLAGTKGTDYRTLGGTGTGDPPTVFNPAASAAGAHLRATLVSWVLFCQTEKVRNSSPHPGLPANTLTAMSRWMLWRIDGLTLHDLGHTCVEDVTKAVDRCQRMIDRPPERQYLGACPACEAVGHDGRLFAVDGGPYAACSRCGQQADAQTLKGRLLDELEDRLCTAAEIAHLSTYLGLHATREQVRKRINLWHHRNRISADGIRAADVTFRFGDVYTLLLVDEVKAG